jgi:hypothetical protein
VHSVPIFASLLGLCALQQIAVFATLFLTDGVWGIFYHKAESEVANNKIKITKD